MSLVVPHGGPANRIAKGGLIRLEETALEFDITASSVGHVAHMDPEIQRPPILFHPRPHTLMDRSLGFPSGPAVAQDPKAVGTHCPRLGLGLKPLLGRFCGESLRTIEDSIVIDRVRGETLDRGFVLKGSDRSTVELGQGEILRSSQAQPLREHRLSIGPETGPGDNGCEGNRLVEPIRLSTPTNHRLDGTFGAP